MKKINLAVLALSGLLLASCTGQTSSTVLNPSTDPLPSTPQSSTPTSSKPTPSTPVSTPTPPPPPVSSTTPPVVKPTVEITNTEADLWVGDTLQITHSFSDGKTYEVEYAVSDDQIASVGTDGVLTGLKSGSVTVTLKSKEDASITATYALTVKDTVIDTAYGFGNWDYSHLKDEAPTISTTNVNAEFPYAETVFRGIVGQKYYCEAVFNVTSRANNEWTRVSLGHRNVGDNYIYRGLQVSPGTPSGNNKKIVMMETPNNWGDTTDRSQVWSMNGISALDFSAVKLGALRDANTYYYFINDVLYWVETIDTRFQDVDTMPAIASAELQCTVSSMMATDDSAAVDAILSQSETQRRLYPSYKENVVISEGDTKIEFKNNNDQAPFSNIKDNCARSLGDAFSIKAGQSAKIEFDLTFDAFGADPNSSIVGLTFNRYSNGPSNARTLGVNKFSAGYTPWDYNGDMPASFNTEAELAAPFAVGATHRIAVTRTVTADGQTFAISVDGVDMGISQGDNYKGALTMTFGCLKANATIANISVTPLE